MFIDASFLTSENEKSPNFFLIDEVLNKPWHIHTIEWKWKLVTQSCLTLWDPVDCTPPGSSVHRILQARILEWVAILFSGGSPWPRDQTQVSCIAGRFYTTEPPMKYYSAIK